MMHKIQIRRNSRKGNSKLKTIVVVQAPPHATIREVDEMRESIRRISPDKYGIIWLTVSATAIIKVYPIK